VIKFKVVIEEDYIDLSSSGRIKRFYNEELVDENIYTLTYPKIFKQIGQTKGFDIHLAKPLLELDYIDDFVSKEQDRDTNVDEYMPNISEEEKTTEEISKAYEEFNTIEEVLEATSLDIEDKNLESE